MAEITHKTAGQLQKGNYVLVDGVASTVSGIQTSRPGKHGHAKVRLSAVGIIDGKKREIVVPGHDHMECPIIGKKNAQVLSLSGSTANVMDMETYETYDLTIPDELKDEVTEGCTVLYWQIMDDRVVKQVVANQE
ncbi:MAG: translation initiation factor IF-5A [Candidatus Woesearchaeota archaeon]|nr:translation initiation factor IF-5A [Candidatus Woesearchaeota archaeon]